MAVKVKPDTNVEDDLDINAMLRLDTIAPSNQNKAQEKIEVDDDEFNKMLKEADEEEEAKLEFSFNQSPQDEIKSKVEVSVDDLMKQFTMQISDERE